MRRAVAVPAVSPAVTAKPARSHDGSGRRATEIDLLVEGTIITMDGANRVIDAGAVAVCGNTIVAIGPAEEIRAGYSAKNAIGGARHIVMPGLIDCHNHLAQSLIRDRSHEDLPGIHRIYIPAETATTVDEVGIAARVAIAQLLRSGATTVAETTATAEHEPVIAQAVMESGIRCAMARGQGDRKSRHAGSYIQAQEKSSFVDDPGKLAADLDACEAFIQNWQSEGKGRLVPWLHAGSIATASDARFLALQSLAARYGTGVMAHVNRDREEIELSMSLFGKRPIEHLRDLGALGPELVAIHAILASDREIRLLAEASVKVAHAPLACTDLLSAVTRVAAMRAAGVIVGLASDTIAHDMFRVMATAFIMQNQAAGIPLYDPVAFTAEATLSMATREAAQVLRWDHAIGSLEMGKRADMAILRRDKLRLSPYDDAQAALVRHAVGEDVEKVVIDGRIVVDGGKVLTLDEAALLQEATELYARLGVVLKPRRYRAAN